MWKKSNLVGGIGFWWWWWGEFRKFPLVGGEFTPHPPIPPLGRTLTWRVSEGIKNGLAIFWHFDNNRSFIKVIEDCRKQQGKLFESVITFFTIELFD